MFLSFWAKTESNFGGFFNLMNVKDQVEIDVRAEKKMFSKLKCIKVDQIFFPLRFSPYESFFQ